VRALEVLPAKYNTLIWLDSDTVVLRNLDFLAHAPTPAFAYHVDEHGSNQRACVVWAPSRDHSKGDLPPHVTALTAALIQAPLWSSLARCVADQADGLNSGVFVLRTSQPLRRELAAFVAQHAETQPAGIHDGSDQQIFNAFFRTHGQ
jgi:lipopolysaccharide biosynthesis glycosyltransferase